MQPLSLTPPMPVQDPKETAAATVPAPDPSATKRPLEPPSLGIATLTHAVPLLGPAPAPPQMASGSDVGDAEPPSKRHHPADSSQRGQAEARDPDLIGSGEITAVLPTACALEPLGPDPELGPQAEICLLLTRLQQLSSGGQEGLSCWDQMKVWENLP